MSFKAEMKIEGVNSNEPYKILSCSYGFSRATDQSGKPQTLIHGGMIHVSVTTSGDTSLSDWMFEIYGYKNGTIEFYKDDADAVAKTLEFTNASLVEYSESYSAGGGMPMTANLSISAEIIKIGQGEHDNEWPKSS